MKFDIWIFHEKLSRKFKFHSNLTRITGTLHEADRYTFLIISRSVLLRMRNVSDKSCGENQNTHFVFNNFFLRKSCLFEIMWRNMVERGRPQMAIRWIPKATNTHLEYVILIAFPLQQWLHDLASMLHCRYCCNGDCVYCAVRTAYCHVTLSLWRIVTSKCQELQEVFRPDDGLILQPKHAAHLNSKCGCDDCIVYELFVCASGRRS